MPDIPVTFHPFASATELTGQLADEIATRLLDALTERKQASLVVSGGSTPKPLFIELSRKKIDWGKVTITLADERWVDITDPASNELLVRSLLLQNEAAGARFIGLKNSAPTAAEGERDSHTAIAPIPRPFDVVILGMGDDGHTASLFPGAKQLPEALNMRSGSNCIAITPPDTPHDRMTMTLPTLLDSREIILHITGNGKKKVLNRAFGKGSSNDMPVRWVLRQSETPVRIFWAP